MLIIHFTHSPLLLLLLDFCIQGEAWNLTSYAMPILNRFRKVFTARRCAQARSLRWPGVRLSVHPSVTLVHCIHTAEDIVFLGSVAPSF